MGRSGGVLWWLFSVWISYICSPSEGTGILEITISFMATDRCFTWNTVLWKSTQRVGKLIYTNRWELERACHRACFSLLLKVVMRVNALGGWTAFPSNWMSLIASCFCWCFTWNIVGWGWLGVCLPSPTSCCGDWCFTWNHSANGKNPSRRPTMFHVKHRHFHKQYFPCLQSCLWKASVPLHMFKSIRLISRDGWSVS